jgi:hypothetical protein
MVVGSFESGASPVLWIACHLCQNAMVKKPKKKRPADANQAAYSIVQQVIALTEKPIKPPKKPRRH